MSTKQKKDRYEMHKYWGKKPSYHLKELIEKYSKVGDTVLDPFSGYGVFCCEAYLLNRNVVSNDLNPIANFINAQLLTVDIDLNKLLKEWEIIRDKFEPYVNYWYKLKVGTEEVQLISILRNYKDLPIKAKFKSSDKNKSFEIALTEEQSQEFYKFENDQIIEDWFPQNELIENSRISAKKEMTVDCLFTKRTLACHARLLHLIETISTGNEKNLFKLAFTANLANCSKLVPPIKTRGEMSQGAWMTGFYIGETYIENNVLQYFDNRLTKIIKGKKDYLKYFENRLFSCNSRSYSITQDDAKNLKLPNESIDYIFTDPPYGDAVPYFEQSIIWNSWLSFSPDYKNEIVISDSKIREKNINSYELEIDKAFSEICRVLKTDSYLSLTYHSLSGLEWKAITNACINNGFEMVAYDWLVQKAFTPRQINKSISIKGDVLVTLKKTNNRTSVKMSDSDVELLFKNEISNWLSQKPFDTNEIFLRIFEIIFTRKIIINNVNLLSILEKYFCFIDNKWTLND